MSRRRRGNLRRFNRRGVCDRRGRLSMSHVVQRTARLLVPGSGGQRPRHQAFFVHHLFG